MKDTKRPIFSTDENQPTGLKITTKHAGKMSGLQSISTDPLTNPLCKRNREIAGSICQKCFACRQLQYRSNNAECYQRNGEILNGSILNPELLPVFTSCYGRIQAFGDIASAIEVINYFNLCRRSPLTRFAMWTKNPQIVAEAIKQGYSKPKNLQIVYSSLFVNTVNVPKFDFIDKVFTVWTSEAEAAKAGYIINCGKRSCFMCGKCYNKNPKSEKIQLIHELLK